MGWNKMAETENTEKEGSQKKARILIADDSKIVRVAASKILLPQFDVVLAEDGEDAWQKICADDTIQVVFTDLGMPNLDGYGLIQRIRQSDNEGIRNQPIIVITGAAEDDAVRRKVFELGATDFITKPFKATEIIARAEAHASYRRDKVSLQKNVDTDLLTGTLNHNGLNKQLVKDVSFVNRHSENLAVILFELDNFKTIYERIGEQSSNRIIKEVATTLLGAIRKEDSVGRYASEKFILVLPMAKTEGVVILAKRLCERIKSFKITIAGETLPLTMSAGIATTIKGNPVTAKNLLHAAEEALVNAREVGVGEVQLLKLEASQADEPPLVISIDGLLESLSKGKIEIPKNEMDRVLQQLAPLVALMTEKQKQQLIK
jgi:two-component system cell cycle response regulator